ncbi:MAG: hypothetical protein MJA84_05850 [Firmicutes bacterium]|nr:hypothetical protein [Bacillota bacterium]
MIVAREKAQHYSLPALPGEKKRPRRLPARGSLAIKEQLALTGLVILFFCSSVFIAFYYAQVLATGYRLNSAETELAMLRKESDDLYTKVNQISSLENVEALAVSRLGMVKPGNDQIILVQTTVPAEQAANTVIAAAGSESVMEDGRHTGGEHERNWVIRAFVKMVGQLEASINAG